MLGFPTLEKPTSENRMQLNKDISNTYPKKKKEKNTDASNPNQSNIHPSIPEATESAAQTTWMNDEFIVDDPILEEPTTVSPLRREADSLTEQQKFLSEPTSIEEITQGIQELKFMRGEQFSIKQMLWFSGAWGRSQPTSFLQFCKNGIACHYGSIIILYSPKDTILAV